MEDNKFVDQAGAEEKKVDVTSVVKKIWNVFSTMIVALIVLCAVFLVGSRLMGYNVDNVISGSM